MAFFTSALTVLCVKFSSSSSSFSAFRPAPESTTRARHRQSIFSRFRARVASFSRRVVFARVRLPFLTVSTATPARNACVARAPFAASSVSRLFARDVSPSTASFYRARRASSVRSRVRVVRSFAHAFIRASFARSRRSRTAATAFGSFIAFALVPDVPLVARFPIVISFQS
jgi:hypothetical protein